MKHLEGLKLVALHNGEAKDPTMRRRLKIVGRLEEQVNLTRDPNFSVTSKRWIKQPDGSRSLVDHQRRINPWWKKTLTGSYVITLKYGNKRLELASGKGGVEVASLQEVEPVLKQLVAAIAAGELDEQLTKAMGHNGQKPTMIKTVDKPLKS